MKARLSKLQIFKNAEIAFINAEKNYFELLDKHKKYRLEYGVSEVEKDFKKQSDIAKRKVDQARQKMKKAKDDLEGN